MTDGVKNRIVVAACAAIFLGTLVLGAAEREPPGPLRIRDMTPPAILTLGFMPSSASLLAQGSWCIETHYSSANIFLMSDEVGAYLKDRADPVELSATDVRQIFDAAQGDIFYFDGEIGVFDIGAHYGVTDNVQVFFELPYYSFGGGNLDHMIMEFHDTFGIGQAGRDLVARDQYQILMRLGDSEFSMLEAPEDGFGDPTIGLRHRIPFPGEGWSAAAEWAIKPAVCNTDCYRSNGHTDFGVQFMVEKLWTRNSLYFSGSYVWLGDFDLADFSPSDVPSATLAYTYRFTDTLTGVVQGLVSRSIFANETSSDLSSIEYQFSFGLRYRYQNALISFALTENIANYQNTPDIGFHIGVCYVFGLDDH